jgi:aspartate/methionine/tyrosine aminotransferase
MAVAALAMPKTYRTEVRDKFEKRAKLITGLLAKAKGFRSFNPEGAFYAF